MVEKYERLPWPITTIDFEASGLGPQTYPIEVGVAVWPSFTSQIEVWSTLIRPTAGWQEGGIWKAEAVAIHGLEKSDLTDGMVPAEAMAKLNELVRGRICWCDGGQQDEYWLTTLSHAAGTAPAFKLGDWDAVTWVLGPEGYRRMIEWMEARPAKHRAGDDAERLLRSVAVGLGANMGGDLSRPAMEAFGNIAWEWRLSESEQVAMLGGRSPHHPAELNEEELLRVSHLVGIYKDINTLLPIRERANLWMRAPNDAFGGTSAVGIILAEGLPGLLRVRRYLAAQTNG